MQHYGQTYERQGLACPSYAAPIWQRKQTKKD